MKKKRKKRSPQQRFLQVFIKSLFIIIALGTVGFMSYKATLTYYDKFGGPKDDKAASLINELYGKVEVTEVSKNLIYAVGEDGKIKAAVLEIFNTKTSNMDYITIPMKAEFTISNELYQKLCSSGCGAPQIIKISSMNEYFNDKTLYEYGVIMLEDLFDIDINYYTVAPSKLFTKMFKQRDAQPSYAQDGTSMQSYYEWKLKKTYIEKMQILRNKENELEDYVKEEVESCKSNLTMRSKLEYVEDYRKVNPALIYTHSIYGTLLDHDFTVNVEETNRLLQEILANSSYTTEQKGAMKVDLAKVSTGYTIEILNGSQITGLAATYKTKFEENGYSITSIGNYTGEQVTQTRILVKEDGLGTDLAAYFDGAVVEKTEYLPNYDIQIILGTDAKVETY